MKNTICIIVLASFFTNTVLSQTILKIIDKRDKNPELTFICDKDCSNIQIETDELLNTGSKCSHEIRELHTISASNPNELKSCLKKLDNKAIRKLLPDYTRRTFFSFAAKCGEWSLGPGRDGSEFLCFLLLGVDIAVSPVREAHYGTRALIRNLLKRSKAVKQISTIRDGLIYAIEKSGVNKSNYIQLDNINSELVKNFFNRVNCL